ncbi:MAG: polysaccharide biosynthesis protein, partial [Armatimonadetes bacterium]|nr:polysaccharide biosynthesis protein [Armatimonadota bacterium]
MGRQEVRLDQEMISRFLCGKALVLMDFSEFNLYRIEMDCHQRRVKIDIQTCLADIRDRELMMQTFASYKPHIVLHAAAYKHVPMQEHHPGEAFKTNVLGTSILAEAALESGVEHFVLVSTDKAVEPLSMYGASKLLAEEIVLREGRKGRHFLVVRFGNVLGSRGSILPLFRKQILKGGPVTVTHPDMR